MRVGDALFDLAGGAGRLFIVGTAKNVGKTVAMRAIAQAAAARGTIVALTSAGRDGEAVDALEAHAKPRLFLRPGALFATARSLLPAHPACELIATTEWTTAAGAVVLARVRRSGYFELAGPATAATLRTCLERLEALGAGFTIVDGALDRIAGLAAGADAAIVCAGAASASTMEEAVSDAAALVRKLGIPAFDPQRPFLRAGGALTPARAVELARSARGHQLVVADATHVLASGKALLGLLEQFDVRCERPIRVAAVTVASIGPEKYFEPAAFARAVAERVRLPVFDVYAGTQVRAA
ncbi:MAG: hypothetical protein ABR508_10270 [Candidatus Baltobacteraceae bacterium]